MADPVSHRSSVRDPALILGLLAIRHYGYYPAPADIRGEVWTILGALVTLALVLSLLWHARGPVVFVAVWWAVEELMVAGCFSAYLIDPWPVVAGQDICSSAIGTDLGKVGALVLAVLALIAARRN